MFVNAAEDTVLILMILHHFQAYFYIKTYVPFYVRVIHTQGRTHGGWGSRDPLNGNRLSANLLLTFVKTQNIPHMHT